MSPEQVAQIMEYVRRAASFAEEQTPLLVQELLRWGAFDALLGVMVCSALLLLSVSYLRRNGSKDPLGSDSPVPLFTLIGALLGVLGGGLGLLVNVGTFIKIQVAPRAYLLEQLAGLLS